MRKYVYTKFNCYLTPGRQLRSALEAQVFWLLMLNLAQWQPSLNPANRLLSGCGWDLPAPVTVTKKLVPGTVATFLTMGAAGSIGQVGVVPMGPVLGNGVRVGAPAKIIGDFSILGMARPALL
jgi:hypothetical protein